MAAEEGRRQSPHQSHPLLPQARPGRPGGDDDTPDEGAARLTRQHYGPAQVIKVLQQTGRAVATPPQARVAEVADFVDAQHIRRRAATNPRGVGRTVFGAFA